MPTDPIASGLREAADAWSLSEAEIASRAELEVDVVRQAFAGEADASELDAIARALGGTIDDLLTGRRFWDAPAAAFKNAPAAFEAPLVRAALLHVASAARDRKALVDLLGIDEREDVSLPPVSLIDPVTAQAEDLAARVRQVLDNNHAPIASLRSAMRRLGVATFLTDFGTSRVDGLCWRDEHSLAAAVNVRARGGKLTALRMTFAHELCHVLFDGSRRAPFGVVEQRTELSEGVEQRANAFAAYLLAPRASVLRFLRERGLSETARPSAGDLRALSEHFIIGVEAMAWHLVNCHLWQTADVQLHRSLTTRDAIGEDNAENNPTPSEECVALERRGDVLDFATTALDRGLISVARWRELLSLRLDDDWRRLLQEREVTRDIEHRSDV